MIRKLVPGPSFTSSKTTNAFSDKGPLLMIKMVAKSNART